MQRGVKRAISKYKKELPARSDFFLTPKGPWEKGRASCTLLLGERASDGKRKYKPYFCAEVIEVERRWKERQISPAEAREAMEKIRDQEYERIAAERKKLLAANNTALAEKFIREVAQKKVDTQWSSRRSQIDGIWSLVKRLGKTDITKASSNEIQRVMNTIETEGTFKKEFTILRSMLRFIKRYDCAESLKSRKFTSKKPPYLTVEQVRQLVENLPSAELEKCPLMPELIRIVFNLGLRIGEALALQKSDVKKKGGTVVVHIQRQYAPKIKGETEQSRIRPPKNKKDRFVIPINKDECLQDLAKWVSAYPEINKRDHYRQTTSKTIHTVCLKLFAEVMAEEVAGAESFFFDEASLQDADDVREYKGVHMLRASHAVHLMEVIGNESFTANQIGDTPEVVRKHYSGRFNTDNTLAAMSKMLEKKSFNQ